MGDRGRLVVPAELRVRLDWSQGTTLLFIETSDGVIVATREQAKSLMRRQLGGSDLVGELLAERREAARADDAA